MKVLGAVLLIVACTLFGVGRASDLRDRQRCTEDALSALRYLDAELTSVGTPMPEIFSALAGREDLRVRCVFRILAERTAMLGEESLGDIWTDCWLRDAGVSLQEPERRALARLGPVLGRYPGPEQSGAVRACIAHFEEAAKQGAVRTKEGAKLSTSVGLTLGLMLAAALV